MCIIFLVLNLNILPVCVSASTMFDIIIGARCEVIGLIFTKTPARHYHCLTYFLVMTGDGGLPPVPRPC